MGCGRLLLRRDAAVPLRHDADPGRAYRNYNRICGHANEIKYVCYGPVGPAGTCYGGTTLISNSSYINIGTSGSYGYGTAAAKCGDYLTLWVDCHSTQP